MYKRKRKERLPAAFFQCAFVCRTRIFLCCTCASACPTRAKMLPFPLFQCLCTGILFLFNVPVVFPGHPPYQVRTVTNYPMRYRLIGIHISEGLGTFLHPNLELLFPLHRLTPSSLPTGALRVAQTRTRPPVRVFPWRGVPGTARRIRNASLVEECPRSLAVVEKAD